MKSVLGAASAALAATASAGMLSLEVARQSSSQAQLSRRADSKVPMAKMFDTGHSYYIELEIGTPPQKVSVSIDTGSSDLWTNLKTTTGYCDDEANQCFTPFNADKSSSLRHLNVTGPHEGSKMPFYVAYGQGDTSVNGTYIADTITVAGATLKNQRLGAANESSFASGIFGLGYNIVFDEQKSKDPLVGHTVVDGLVKSGAINRRLFSLALGHTEDTNGTITFGGVDTGLYYDSLVGVPLVPSRGSPRVVEYTVKLEGLEVKGLDGVKSSDKNVTVLLDNGAPEIMLPDEMVKPILDKFGTRSIKVDGRERGSFTNCALGRKYADSRFGFKFAGKTIYISGQQVVRDTLSDGEQNYVKDKIGSDSDDWDGVCQLIFAPHLEGLPYLVGDPLLRHAYAVYDMDNKEVGLAQANFNSTKHNLVEIGKDDGIPKDKGEPLPKSISEAGAGSDGDVGSHKGSGDDGKDNSGKNGGDKGDNDGKDDETDAAGMLGTPVFGMLLAVVAACIMM